MYSRLAVSKEAISASSWAKARMRRAPEKFSWALAEMSENMAWMRSKRVWMRAPNYCTRTEAMGRGTKAKRVRRGLMRIMNGRAAAVKTMVLAEVHDGRAEQLADGGEVVGGAGHDVAGAVGVVEGGGLALEVGEEIVAEVEFDLARGADDDLAGDVEEEGGEDGDAEQAEGVEGGFCAR